MDDHFHSSHKELRLQLDLMNSRTASILNKPGQQSNMLTPDSSRVDFSPSVTVDNMQQIKHIGATVGTLAKHQEDRFQALERQLNALSNKLDDLVLGNPQFTPPESPSESASVSSRSDTASISSQNPSMPCSPSSDMPPATVADVGGYFYPDYVQRGRSDQQFITDASSFVGRVYRVLRTKSIPNIEIFLRGSALRWFHLGLRTDGTHLFDMFSGDFSLINFCDSLISLFGVPESSASAANIKTLPLTPSWMRSVIIEDYIFPALEYVRPQENLYDVDSGASVAVSKALALYNQSSKPCTVSPEIYDCTADAQIQDMCDLQSTLRDIRCSELEQKLNRLRSRESQIGIDAVSAELGIEGSKKKSLSSSEVEQDSMPAAVSSFNGKTSTSTLAGMYDRPEAQPKSCSLGMPDGVEFEGADSLASAVESYPPAPTAESCATTPIASCQPLSAFDIPFQEGERSIQIGDKASTDAVIARWSQRTAELKAKDKVDQSRPMARDTMPFFSSSIIDKSRLGLSTPADKCPFLRESAEIKAILDDIPIVQAPDPPSDDEDDKQKWYDRPKYDDTTLEAGNLHIPEGADKCLAGLTFVFTGQLTHLTREQGEDLVKRYGGKCTTAPSKKTSFVVLGAEAGPKKLAVIKQYNLRVINEKGLFALISRLPARDRVVPEPKKEMERPTNANGDFSPTTTATPCQEDGLVSTTTSDSQPQQQPPEQQPISQAQKSFTLGPQAKAYLNGFRVCPPPNISPNTSEYENYQRSIMSTLSTLLAIQTSGRNRIDEVLTEIQELQNAGQNTPPDLLSACYTAMKDEQTATDKIDAITSGNYKNRLALMNKLKQPPKRKTLVAPRRNSSVNARPCTTQLATSAKSENEE